MVNRNIENTAIPDFEGKSRLSSDLPARAPNDFGGGIAATFRGAMQNLAGLTGRILNTRAAHEGDVAGQAAGLDPNVELQDPTTIRGAAFNKAAMRSYLGQMEVNVRGEALGAYEANKDNPAALEAALSKLRNTLRQDVLPEATSDFETLFSRQSLVLVTDAETRHEALVLDQGRAAFKSGLTARLDGIERIAFLSGSDAQAEELLTGEMHDLEALLLDVGPKGAFEWGDKIYEADAGRDGLYDLEGIEALLSETGGRAREARVMGKFSKIAGLTEQIGFRDDFLSSYFNPDTGEFDDVATTGLSRARVEALGGRMTQKINAAKTGLAASNAAFKRTVKDYMRVLEKGYPVDPADLKAIEAQVLETGDPELTRDLAEAKGLSTFQTLARQMRPEELAHELGRFEAAARAGGATPDNVRRLEIGERLLEEMKTELKSDPVGWAARQGFIEKEPVALAGEGADQTMLKRRDQAHAIAERYSLQPQFFTPEETTVLAAAWAEAPVDEKLAMLGALTSGFGEDTPKALAEFSKKAPLAAHVGGLIMQGPQFAATAHDILIGAAAQKEGAAFLPAREVVDEAFINEMGTALGPGLATTSANIRKAADAIYTARAIEQGQDPARLDKRLYQKAIHEASGGWTAADGTQYGGVAEWRNHELILPSTVSEDEFEDLMKGVTDADLEAISVGGGAPTFGLGARLDARSFKRSYLVTSGDGRFLVSTTPPSEGPTWLNGSGRNGLYEIDLNELKRRHALLPGEVVIEIDPPLGGAGP